MARTVSSVDPSPSLLERKRRRVRERIVECADELFSSRGFDHVSVSDIAARADVGRTTFFRYFGDKTEVVFAKEQAMLEAIALAAGEDAVGVARTSREAVGQLRPIVLDLCRQAVQDGEAYRRHAALVEQHLDLRARDALKTQQIAHALAAVLQSRGTAVDVAAFAAEIALACYRTALRGARTGGGLVRDTEAAFDQTLTLGSG